MIKAKPLFSRFLDGASHLHFAAHSHHPWPDVSFEAHKQAWLDAAKLIDAKWEHVLGEVVPTTRAHIARQLNLSTPSNIALEQNTHTLLVRLFSALPSRQPVKILSTDGEFHSFQRQSQRWEEAGLAAVHRVAVEPFDSFEERYRQSLREEAYDLVYLSQVFFNSGFSVQGWSEIIDAISDQNSFVVVDGYHGFMAIPTDLSRLEHRCFYLAGGYKYAMSGEGVCFMHCPPGYGDRPNQHGMVCRFRRAGRRAQGPG